MKKNNKKKQPNVSEKKVEPSPAKAVMTSKKNKKNKMAMYIVLGVLTFLLALTVAIGVIYSTTKPTIDTDNPFNTPDPVENVTPENNDAPKKTVSADGRKQEMYNLLVLGKDYWSSSTDVIMIVSVNTAKKDISVLQIPRDSTVDCGLNENHGKRVNAIYAYAMSALRSAASNPSKEYTDPSLAKVVPTYLANLKDTKDSKNKEYNEELRSKMAVEYLKETLKQTFCIAIDGYAMVDVAGFREIVDVLGGVEVDVPQNMDYDDPTQNLHIHLKKGTQVLNGSDAEGFVRYRYGYVDGDIGRVNAQKIFLSALAKKIMSFSTVTKIQPLIETCLDYTTTNLTLTDIIGYVKIFLDMDLGNIKFYTAPGEAYRTSSGAWYYSLYMDETLEIINEHFNDYERTVTADDVTLRQVVKNYNISYNNQGISAEDIENSELNLTKSNVTYNPSTSTSANVSGTSGESNSSGNTTSNTNTDTDTALTSNDNSSDNTADDTSELPLETVVPSENDEAANNDESGALNPEQPDESIDVTVTEGDDASETSQNENQPTETDMPSGEGDSPEEQVDDTQQPAESNTDAATPTDGDNTDDAADGTTEIVITDTDLTESVTNQEEE